LSVLHLIIPTLNAGALWHEVIKGIQAQVLPNHLALQVLIVDSESSDDTRALAQAAGFKVCTIPRNSFGHGSTRQDALEMLPQDSAFVVYITQDAVLKDPSALEKLLKPFEDPRVAASYGRQLPHENATWFAAQLRHFNYPSTDRVSSFEDRFERGLKAVFLSNSFAAYRLSMVREVGGFPRSALCAEDMLLGAKLLKKGALIAYAAQAHVLHSHNDSLWQDFKRYFDTGVVHDLEKESLADFGGVQQQGRLLLSHLLKALGKEGPWTSAARCLDVLTRLTSKSVAYRLGRLHRYMPLAFKQALSMSKTHWKSRSQ